MATVRFVFSFIKLSLFQYIRFVVKNKEQGMKVRALPLACGKRSGFSPFRCRSSLPCFASLRSTAARRLAQNAPVEHFAGFQPSLPRWPPAAWLQSLTQENILYFPYPFYQACNEINKKSAFKKLLKNYDIFLKIPKKI